MNDFRANSELQRGRSNLCPQLRKIISCELWRTVGKTWLWQWLLNCAFLYKFTVLIIHDISNIDVFGNNLKSLYFN